MDRESKQATSIFMFVIAGIFISSGLLSLLFLGAVRTTTFKDIPQISEDQREMASAAFLDTVEKQAILYLEGVNPPSTYMRTFFHDAWETQRDMVVKTTMGTKVIHRTGWMWCLGIGAFFAAVGCIMAFFASRFYEGIIDWIDAKVNRYSALKKLDKKAFQDYMKFRNDIEKRMNIFDEDIS